MDGALTSYQSLREKGSTLQYQTSQLDTPRRWTDGQPGQQPYVFFLPPFFPLEIRLFLPTAMLGNPLCLLYLGLAVLALTRPPAAEHDQTQLRASKLPILDGLVGSQLWGHNIGCLRLCRQLGVNFSRNSFSALTLASCGAC